MENLEFVRIWNGIFFYFIADLLYCLGPVFVDCEALPCRTV